MKNIYDFAYQILSDITTITSKGDTKVQLIIDFLTAEKSSKELFSSYEFGDFEPNSVKKVVMLTIFSCAYLVNLYDIKRGVNEEQAEAILEQIRNLTPQEIINLFNEYDSLIATVLDDVYDYLDNTYIFRYCCWLNLLAENKQKELLRLNPFVIFEYDALDLGDSFKEMEVTIQLFNDIYDKALEETAKDPELGDENDREFFNNLFIENFYSQVDEHFQNNDKAIAEFYSLILGNVYESLTNNAFKSKKNKRIYKSLLETLEKKPVSELITSFLTDSKFAITIIDAFLSINDVIEKDELIKRRTIFNQKGNIKRLREFNPYYQSDEQVLKRKKEGSKI